MAAALALALGVGLPLAGCAKFDAALGKREAVVYFHSGTPDSVRLKVRAACSGVRGAAPEPLPTDHKASDLLYNVRYTVSHATDAQLAELQTCLQRFPSVVGVHIVTPSQ